MLRRIGSQIKDWAGVLALFLVLAGGTAYAANTIISSDIVDGQVKTVDLGSAAVTVDKLANGSVTSDKVKDASLAGRDVLDNSLKGSDIDESTLAGLGGGGGIGAPEAWRQVGPGSSSQDLCGDPSRKAVFCSDIDPLGTPRPWTNLGAGFATAGFYKDQLGIVHLKGLVRIGIIYNPLDPIVSPIFRLPAAYAPDKQRVFPTVGRNPNGQEVTSGRVDVRPDGLVIFEQDCVAVQDGGLTTATDCSADGEYVTLDGVAFRPDA